MSSHSAELHAWRLLVAERELALGVGPWCEQSPSARGADGWLRTPVEIDGWRRRRQWRRRRDRGGARWGRWCSADGVARVGGEAPRSLRGQDRSKRCRSPVAVLVGRTVLRRHARTRTVRNRHRPISGHEWHRSCARPTVRDARGGRGAAPAIGSLPRFGATPVLVDAWTRVGCRCRRSRVVAAERQLVAVVDGGDAALFGNCRGCGVAAERQLVAVVDGGDAALFGNCRGCGVAAERQLVAVVDGGDAALFGQVSGLRGRR